MDMKKISSVSTENLSLEDVSSLKGKVTIYEGKKYKVIKISEDENGNIVATLAPSAKDDKDLKENVPIQQATEWLLWRRKDNQRQISEKVKEVFTATMDVREKRESDVTRSSLSFLNDDLISRLDRNSWVDVKEYVEKYKKKYQEIYEKKYQKRYAHWLKYYTQRDGVRKSVQDLERQAKSSAEREITWDVERSIKADLERMKKQEEEEEKYWQEAEESYLHEDPSPEETHRYVDGPSEEDIKKMYPQYKKI